MAARSFAITLRNFMGQELSRSNLSIAHGIFSDNGNAVPPERIGNPARVSWQSESDGFATGTQGSVTYATPVGDVFIGWDNPFIGSNGLGVGVPNGFVVEHGSIDGNDANVTITITPNI
jgi:hypothetical protein